MKTKSFTIIIVAICLLLPLLLLSTASADTGPKPTVNITVTGLPQSDYTVMFLSDKSNGPWLLLDEYEHYIQSEYREEIYQTALKISPLIDDNEPWQLLLWTQKFENTTTLDVHFGYYPPQNFKLVVYDEVANKVYVSDQCERYAFSSYFDATLTSNDLEIEQGNAPPLIITKNHQPKGEAVNFIVRVIITIAIEFSFALLFKFDKKSYIIILVTNVLTQILLNVGINLFIYNYGLNLLGLIPLLLFAELIIFVIESVVYKTFCNRVNKGKKWIITYAILANLLSFVIGTTVYGIITSLFA